MNNIPVSRFKIASGRVVSIALKAVLLLVVAVAWLPPSRTGFLFPPYN